MIRFLILSVALFWHLHMMAQPHGISKKEALPRGLEVGAHAPDFSAIDQHGKVVQLRHVLNKNDVVLIFYRGVWCPVCMRYLSNLQDSLSYLQEQEVSVIAVTPETPENIQRTQKKTSASFVLLSDPGDSIMTAYDVRFKLSSFYQLKVDVGRLKNVSRSNDQKRAALPVPATYIINQQGIITFRQFDPDYKERASVRDMLHHIKSNR